MEELKPDQALNMLVSAARQARLTYEEHAALEQAVRVLLTVVPMPEQPPEGVEENVAEEEEATADA